MPMKDQNLGYHALGNKLRLSRIQGSRPSGVRGINVDPLVAFRYWLRGHVGNTAGGPNMPAFDHYSKLPEALAIGVSNDFY